MSTKKTVICQSSASDCQDKQCFALLDKEIDRKDYQD